jgi:hypothetical protein
MLDRQGVVCLVAFLLTANNVTANNGLASGSESVSSEPFGFFNALALIVGGLVIMFVIPALLSAGWEGIKEGTKYVMSKIPSKIKTALLVVYFVAILGFILWIKYLDWVDEAFFESVKKGNIEEVSQSIMTNGDILNKKDEYLGTPCHIAAKANNIDMLNLLIKNGANVNQYAKLGNDVKVTPLMSISGSHNVDAARILIEAGADVNLMGKGAHEGRMTALHGAAASGNLEMVKLLVVAGADIHQRGANEFTPLHFALGNVGKVDKVPVVTYLLDKGADVNAEAMGGMTPLHFVSIRGTPEIVRLLVSRGANVNAKAQNGSTPLDISRRKGREGLVKIMEQSLH